MATFTLADLKNEVAKKYANTVIENGSDQYVLTNLLQLPQENRKKVIALTEKLDDKGNDQGLDTQVEVFKEIVTIVTEGGKGKELLDLIGDNVALIVELGVTWMDGTQVGEAEPSSE